MIIPLLFFFVASQHKMAPINTDSILLTCKGKTDSGEAGWPGAVLYMLKYEANRWTTCADSSFKSARNLAYSIEGV